MKRQSHCLLQSLFRLQGRTRSFPRPQSSSQLPPRLILSPAHSASVVCIEFQIPLLLSHGTSLSQSSLSSVISRSIHVAACPLCYCLNKPDNFFFVLNLFLSYSTYNLVYLSLTQLIEVQLIYNDLDIEQSDSITPTNIYFIFSFISIIGDYKIERSSLCYRAAPCC